MPYSEDQMLMLSGIQHFVFCPRQWALIHIEQQWNDNRFTAEGEILHANVDDPSYRQKNGKRITLRSVSIASASLGLYGISDAVELIPSDSPENAILHPRYPGYWKPMPIEYKRGKVKPDMRDEVQLAAQVLCLEEQYGIFIDEGALFYWETRSREYVRITEELRRFTKDCADKMHEIMASGITPAIQKKPHCRNCSLVNECLPSLARCSSVRSYLKTNLYEEAP
mgnify:CR=1 FL=1|jgi:CRISPR-associated exonuclease Cas4